MKKFYSLTIGLLFGLASTQAQVVNVTTGTDYGTNLLKACNDAADGNVIQVSQSVSVDNRLLLSKNITIEGVGEGVTIINTKNSMIAGIDSGKTMTFKNLTLTSIQNLSQYFEISQNNSAMVMENVTIKDISGNKSAGLFGVKTANGIQLTLNNVKIENCTTSAPYDIKLWHNLQLNLSGDNSLSIGVSYDEDKGNTKINVAGELTNTTPIPVIYEGEIGKTLVTNCTDPSKFKLTDPELSLVADGNNLVVKSVPVVVESSDASADGYYESLQAAIAKISASTATEATITLGSNQTVTSRITMQDGKIYNVVPAEGKDISITVGSNNIAFLTQKGTTLNFSDLTISGTGKTINRNQLEVKNADSKISFNNVKFSNLDLGESNVFRAIDNGVVKLNNITIENCNVPIFAFFGASGSEITGGASFDMCIDGDNSVNAAGWAPSEQVTVTLTKRSKNSDVLLNFTNIDILKITNTDWALYTDGKNIRTRNDKAPAPVANIADNEITLTAEEDCTIYYMVTDSDVAPAANEFESLYNGAIDAAEFTNSVNYVWAITRKAGYVDSEVVRVGMFNNEATEGITYSLVESAEQLQNGFWCVVVAKEGEDYFAMGPDMQGTKVNVTGNVINAFKQDFDGKVSELQYNQGSLIEKGAAVSRAVQLTVDALTVKIGNDVLGYDAATNTFSAAGANKNIMLFSTGNDKNTGVDDITVDDTEAPVEYYNLQGVRVENPANGLYIKRQGSKVEKVIIR